MLKIISLLPLSRYGGIRLFYLAKCLRSEKNIISLVVHFPEVFVYKVEEDSERLDAIDYDVEAIAKMVARNQLSIGKIKLYVAEITRPDRFAFYYSKNVLEAHALQYYLGHARAGERVLARLRA